MIFIKNLKILFIFFFLFAFNQPGIGEEPPITEAHKLLVKKNHLGNLKTPTKLKYIFKKTGSLEPPFNDRVIMIVPEKNDKGVFNIQFDFFSGYNKEDLTSAQYKATNPIFHAFWDHDIKIMTRITEGSVVYFRKRITWSLSDVNKFNINEATCEYEGKKLKGFKIEHSPYEDDYDSKRFEKYAKKKYFITLCDDIPGMIYQMGTLIPDASSETPLMKEILTFEKILK